MRSSRANAPGVIPEHWPRRPSSARFAGKSDWKNPHVGAKLPTAVRFSGFVTGAMVLAVLAGCAGSSSHQSDSAGRTTAVQYAAMLMTGGSARTVIHGVRIEWQREQDGHVCYTA